MLSFLNGLRIFGCWFVSVLTAVVSFFTAGISLKAEMPKTPDDFEPVMRFAICSDVHIKDGEAVSDETAQAAKDRLKKFFNVVYDYADNCDSYTGVDAFAFAGDFTDRGLRSQYEVFNQICEENIREGTERIVCSGNHEYINYRDVDRTEGGRVFREMIGESNTHYVIGGYHFISVSYDDESDSYIRTAPWLIKELNKAKKDSGDRPIFVMHHPAPFGTVYGSVNWGDVILPAVLSAYPQVVDFSGHSHYPVNDPRSIWQGTFTALGCGTLAYFETELDMQAGNFPFDEEQAAQFYIVEGDKDGNLRIAAYDLITDSFFDSEYYLTDLANKNYPYSYASRMAYDKAPVFENPDFSTKLNENGETVLCFNGAKDKLVTESYKLTVRKGTEKVYDESFSGKYMYLFMDDSYEINLGKLETGCEYKVSLAAVNAYCEKSALQRFSFTAQ